MERVIIALALVGVATAIAGLMLATALLHSSEEISEESFEQWKRKEMENK